MSGVTVTADGVAVPSATQAGTTYLVRFHGTQSGLVHWECNHPVVRFGAALPLVRLGPVPCSHCRQAAALLVQEGLVVLVQEGRSGRYGGSYRLTGRARHLADPEPCQVADCHVPGHGDGLG